MPARSKTEAQLLASAAGPEKQVTLLFSAISLVAGIILAYNALLLASDERRRFIVYLIETGTPDSMIVASLAFDAFILGLVGSVLGLLAGDVISLIAYRTVPGYIAAAFAIGGQRVVGLPTVLIALGGRNARSVRRRGAAGGRRASRGRRGGARSGRSHALTRAQAASLRRGRFRLRRAASSASRSPLRRWSRRRRWWRSLGSRPAS